MSSTSATRAHPVAIHAAAFGAGGDVVEHELVGALVAIALGEHQDVAHDLVIAEANALYDLAVADVEAGDDAFGKNGRNSEGLINSSNKALPLMAAAAPSAASARQVGGRAHAARGLPGDLRIALHGFGVQRQAGPCSAPSSSTSVHSTCLQAMRQIGVDGFPERELRFLGPAARQHARHTLGVVADVEGQADLLGAVFLEPGLHLGGLFHRGAADDDAVDAIAQQVVDHRRRAHAATHLDVQGALRGEADDDAAIGEPAVLGAVEIHDVQPARAQRAIALQQLVRLEVVARLGVEIALEQAHAAAAAQIDGGDEDHGFGLFRKFARMRAPTTPERSGWNCVPQKLSRRATAVNAAP